jgi:MOSC domain-containing protein YiiM
LEANIKNIAIGSIKTYKKVNDNEFNSAYIKDNSFNFLNLYTLGLEGDFQADKKYHGGIDKAILIASEFHFENFKKIYNKDMNPFVMGQNILIDSLDESNVYVGDIYSIDDIQIQVTQPRQPCWKIETIFDKDISDYIISNHATGWYAKVLNEGVLDINDQMVLTKRVSNLTIKDLSKYLITPPSSKETIDEVLNSNYIANSYKNDFQKALKFKG